MQVFSIDTELRKHTILNAIATQRRLIEHPIVETPDPYRLAKVYAVMGIVSETAACLLAYNNAPDALKFTLFQAALAESAQGDIKWGMDNMWLAPNTAQASISRGLRDQQELALLQLKKSVAALGLSE